MILTVTPNPALDITYECENVQIHNEHRVQRVRTSPGGKGVNVAQVLAQLEHDVTCMGPLGGSVGRELSELLTARASRLDGTIRQRWTPISASTRRTVFIVDDGGATGFNEPGPLLDEHEAATFVDEVIAEAAKAQAVTISGSLAQGLGAATISEMLADITAPVLVDTSGPALLTAAQAGAFMIKPNRAEATAATGMDDPIAAARRLVDEGATWVACSLGADGMVLIGAQHGWRATLPTPLTGNATGAGDASVALLASTLLIDETEPAVALREAVAYSASAVTCPTAGAVDPSVALNLMDSISVKDI